MKQAISPTSADRRNHTPKPKLTSLFVFGDSLSDTGNLSTFTYLASEGQFWFPPSPPIPSPNPPFGGDYYAKVPYYNSVQLPPLPFNPNNAPEVRASNGLIWADLLPNDLGLPPSKVSNFAYAGATTGSTNGLQPFLPASFPALPGLLSEIDDFTNKLGSGKAAPNGLYVVWAGGNDGFNLVGQLANSPPSNLRATLPIIAGAAKTAVKNIETAITTLAGKGARTFLVPNLPDVGAAPLFHLPTQSKDSIFVGKVFTLAFDIALAAKLPKLERSLKIDIVQPDVYTLTQEAFNRPQEFGFANVRDPLIAQDPNDPLVNPDKFFWYDYQHPTAKAHEVLADFFQDNLYMSGYINHGSTEILPQLTGGLLSNETNLAGTSAHEISDLTSLGLNKELLGLITG